MASIHLQGIWKRYGSTEAVIDLSLVCQDGEMLALLGPSGCGKSSTLKMIAGIEPVSRGEILFGSRRVTELRPSERNLAMVFEDYALYPHLSVYDNVAFPLKVRGAATAEIAQRVRTALDFLSLSEWRDHDVRALSGGAQQRVAIGRALVRQPELVLFDEPLSHLDADQKVHLRTEIKRLQQRTGLTSILVTHDQIEAIAMADRVAVMNNGVLQQFGSPQELYERPRNLFVANFIGEPPMNLLPARFVTEASQTRLVGNGWSVPIAAAIANSLSRNAQSREVIAGIRPEHIAVGAIDAIDTTIAGDASTCGIVFDVEPRGDVDVLLIDLSNVETSPPRIVAEIANPVGFAPGQKVSMRLSAERLNFFDAQSGVNLLLE